MRAAGVTPEDDPEMARGVGINVHGISMVVFALGAFLAAVAGVVAGGFVGVYPGADFEILPYAFVVVIVGGMGSLKGAMIGSLADSIRRKNRSNVPTSNTGLVTANSAPASTL